MEILRKVKVTDRLPIIEQSYYIIDKHGAIDAKDFERLYDTTIWIENVEYWYEPIEGELDSEKILPPELRVNNAYKDLDLKADFCGIINLYKQALETAELKNMQLISCIPSTFYNNLEPIERLNKLVEIWNRSIKVIDQLQEELREVKGMLDYTNKLDEEFRIKQEKDLKRISEHFKFRNPNEEADKRYNKALELFKQTYHVTEQEFIDRYPHINNMFKIAAYGK